MPKYRVWVYPGPKIRVIEADNIVEVSKIIKNEFRLHNGYLIIPYVGRVSPKEDPFISYCKYWGINHSKGFRSFSDWVAIYGEDKGIPFES